MTATYETCQIRMLRPYRAYRTNQIVTVTPGLADMLQRAGYAVPHKAAPRLEFAVAPEPADLEVAVDPVATAKRPRRRKLS